MNKQKLTKTFNLTKWVLFVFFTVGLAMSSCKDYDDDIKRLEEKIQANSDAIKALEKGSVGGITIESITRDQANKKVTIKTSDGKTYEIFDGKDGKDGKDGTPGTPGTAGTASDIDIKENADGTVTFKYKDAQGAEKTFVMNKSTADISGIKFAPYYLSQGEAARIHFPTIKTNDGKSIIYAGKAELRYQVNPSTVSFDAFEVVGFVRDTAEIWNYGTPNDKLTNNKKQILLFDKGQKLYTDGKLTKAGAYAEGKGMLTFRAKDWAFAEQSNANLRNVYSLRLKNGDKVVHSDFIPAKHEIILEKDVHMVRKTNAKEVYKDPAPVASTIAPRYKAIGVDRTSELPVYPITKGDNTTDYREFIPDFYYKDAQKSYSPEEYLKLSNAEKSNVENLPENIHYRYGLKAKNGTDLQTPVLSNKDERIHVNIKYKDEVIDLKKIVLNFFDNRAGVADKTQQYVLDSNGFDDYTLEFEMVDFYYDGVNQTKRYLALNNGEIRVQPNSVWGEVTGEAGHTAAIGRTPIVRVKLVTPSEDQNVVVKTAIIKINIVREETLQNLPIVLKKEVLLKHIDQNVNMDMDPIFYDPRIGMSSAEFYDKYEWVDVIGVTEADDHKTVSLTDKPGVSGNQYHNQLVTRVKNTAFNADCVLYKPQGYYKLKAGKSGPVEKITVIAEVKVLYPEVPASKRVSIYWAQKQGLPNTNLAHGKYNEYPVTQQTPSLANTYKMEAVLSNFYTDKDEKRDYDYPSYTGDKKDDARITISYELVNIHNDASDLAGHSGVRIIQRQQMDRNGMLTGKTEWVLELERSDLGRGYIFENEAAAIKAAVGDKKIIKVRRVASFNECVDGLYGTSCKPGYKAEYKFNKKHADSYATQTALVNGKLYDVEVCSTPDSQNITHGNQPPYGNKAPERGRYKVLEEFDVRFVDPIKVLPGEIETLYDKYVNKIDLNKAVIIGEYLYDGALGNNSYVIYNQKLANKTATGINTNPGTVTFDANGWNQILKSEFDVLNPFKFYIKDYRHIDDNSKVVLGNNHKFFVNANNQLEWDNAGEDIAREFYVVIEVCVNHKWGAPCAHGTNQNQLYGHSVYELKIPVKKWNSAKP